MNSPGWQRVEIRSLGRVLTGRTPPSDRPDLFGDEVPFLTPSDMEGSRRIRRIARALSREGAQEFRRLLVSKAVAVSCIGWQLGKVVLVDETTLTNQQINTIVPDTSVVDRLYLYYSLLSLRADLFRLASGGSRTPIVSKSVFEKVRIALPPRDAQIAIAEFLGVLDDKIELNDRTRQTLESIARTVFNSWFVDFAPVRERHPLFPRELESTSLGLIPRGWEVGRIDDLLSLQRGYDLPANARVPGKHPVISASGPSGTHSAAMAKGPGVTIGRSGVLGRVHISFEDFWPLNTTLWIKDFRRSGPAYAYFLLQSLHLERFNAGSAVPTLNRNHLHGLPTLNPPPSVMQEFEKLALPLLHLCHFKDAESRNLSSIRDTLLPRLLSGEICIKRAERIIENSV